MKRYETQWWGGDVPEIAEHPEGDLIKYDDFLSFLSKINSIGELKRIKTQLGLSNDTFTN